MEVALRNAVSFDDPKLLKQKLHSYFLRAVFPDEAQSDPLLGIPFLHKINDLLDAFKRNFIFEDWSAIEIPALVAALKQNIQALKKSFSALPRKYPLDEISMTLATFQDDQLQIPGQYVKV